MRARRAGCVLAVAAAVLVACSSPSEDQAAPERPNIVLILTDDQTLESLRVMRHTQELIADRGVAFETAIATYPLCCPARATLLTGQYALNTGVLQNFSGGRQPGGYPAYRDGAEPEALPVALEQNGYRTALVGKYMNEWGLEDPTIVPPGWDDWLGAVTPSVNNYLDTSLSRDGVVEDHPGEYQTDLLTQEATEVIESQDPEGDPLFLVVGYLAPHTDDAARADGDLVAIPAPRHEGRFADEPLPDVPSFDHHDPAKPAYTSGLAPLDADTQERITRLYRSELATLLAVDDGVAAIDQALREQGLHENTVVIYTSDNGYLHGEHRHRFKKHLPYEPSIRVPFLMAGPGIAHGTANALTANIDVATTIYDLTGTTPIRPPDGRSLRPLLEDPGQAWDRTVLLTSRVGRPSTPTYDGVRSPTYTYVRYRTGGRFEYELFDLSDDPFELQNLVNASTGRAIDPADQVVVDELDREMRRLLNCAGASCD